MQTIGTFPWWGLIVGVSFAVVGVVEYIKGFFNRTDGANPIPSWAWRLVLLVVSAGAGASLGGGLGPLVINAGAIIATSQIGYPILVKIPKALIDGLIKKAS